MPHRKPAVSEIQLAANRARHYRRAIEEFERLKALRPELPNEPILDAQPEVEEPLAPQPNEPISAGNPGVVSIGGLPPDNPSK
jgi:hypothetical protein